MKLVDLGPDFYAISTPDELKVHFIEAILNPIWNACRLDTTIASLLSDEMAKRESLIMP